MQRENYSIEDFICDESFQKFCHGQDGENEREWHAWILSHPQKQEEVNEARRVISILSGNQGNVKEQIIYLQDGIARYAHLRESIQTGMYDGQPAAGADIVAPVYRLKRRRKLALFAAAAACIIIVSASVYLLLPHRQSEMTTGAVHQTVIRSGSEPRKTVVLPDNSVVTLRNNSTITLSSDFNRGRRELLLSGEAFFDVTHDANHPFIVHTADVNIEVLGTVFNVSAYPSARHTETSLFRGKVSVSPKDHPDQKVILTPSKKIIVAANVPDIKLQAQIIPLSADPVNHKAKEIAWIRNRLKIEDEPLSVIAAKLQSWYGINITFEDQEVKTYRYSGTFESETVLKALEALQLSYPFTFRVEKDRILIGK